MTICKSLPYQGIARGAKLKPIRPRPIFDDDFVIITSTNRVITKLDWNTSPFIKGANIQFIAGPTTVYQHYIICKIKKHGR